MREFDELYEVICRLRAEDGCPWDREQTHMSLKAACIEEAAEVICGINVYDRSGNAENLKEELGDLLLQVLMHARIAEEEGIFTTEDVINGIKEKMIRRHPHVFGNTKVNGSEEVLLNWEEIKAREKEGKEDVGEYLAEAFNEADELIDAARKRKGYK
ncbi:MAG: nucleotide pyrophosphohydrolase [Lachnospiraceae bacterium]|nr:nucleotide pyrophosphohydrolase [Lachnospiraceae bacterium]